MVELSEYQIQQLNGSLGETIRGIVSELAREATEYTPDLIENNANIVDDVLNSPGVSNAILNEVYDVLMDDIRNKKRWYSLFSVSKLPDDANARIINLLFPT